MMEHSSGPSPLCYHQPFVGCHIGGGVALQLK